MTVADIVGVLQGGGMVAFSALVYLELRDLRKALVTVLLRTPPRARTGPVAK